MQETSLGARIQSRRKQLKLSRVALAQRLGISRIALEQIERGVRRQDSAGWLRAMATTLETSADYLVGLTDSPQQKESVCSD